MSVVRPPLPARRTSGVPPPPPPRRSAPIIPNSQDEQESPKLTGIAARIASLQLDHVGKPTISGKPKLPERVPQPVTPEEKLESEEREPEIEKAPPPPPPRRGSSVSLLRRPTWDEVEARGPEFVRALSRKPPPIPPKPTRLPTPPPEPEPVYEEPEQASETSTLSCIKCYDFSSVDNHAAQFPRHTIVSLDQLSYDLTSPWETETEKFRAIFTWLHHNIAYDADAFFCGNVQASTPEATLESGLAVCDGYAGLFTSLAERSGLQAMKVTGHGKGFGYIPTEAGGLVPQYQGNHAWNCALMDGEWRLVDSCWGAGAVSSSGFSKLFKPTWFTFTNAEFGKRHYPEDPAYQLISDEDGGPVSWEDYILEPEGPLLFNDFYDHDFSPQFVQPSTKYLQSGTWVSFHLFKLCEHISTAEADNYVHVISLPDGSRTPLTLNDSGGWSATVYVPAGDGEVSLFYITKIGDKDAKGLTVRDYNASVGRKAMYFGGLCRWTVV
ncbi:hypothetical protein EV361DRAFT_878035 [Lentinula raphanica]|nr:hypothetical protein EV361DRAFT_878035 [Lentinula raphanica]